MAMGMMSFGPGILIPLIIVIGIFSALTYLTIKFSSRQNVAYFAVIPALIGIIPILPVAGGLANLKIFVWLLPFSFLLFTVSKTPIAQITEEKKLLTGLISLFLIVGAYQSFILISGDLTVPSPDRIEIQDAYYQGEENLDYKYDVRIYNPTDQSIEIVDSQIHNIIDPRRTKTVSLTSIDNDTLDFNYRHPKINSDGLSSMECDFWAKLMGCNEKENVRKSVDLRAYR